MAAMVCHDDLCMDAVVTRSWIGMVWLGDGYSGNSVRAMISV